MQCTKRSVKGLIGGVIIISNLITATAFAVEQGTKIEDANIAITEAGIVSPFSMYLSYGAVTISGGTGVVIVKPVTKAFTNIEHIYHDVHIYKNGTIYSSQRFDAWNSATLTNSIKVPAKEGDFFNVVVGHYTYHNGVTESDSSSQSYNY